MFLILARLVAQDGIVLDKWRMLCTQVLERRGTIQTIGGSSTPDLVYLDPEAPTGRPRPPERVANPPNHTRSGTCAEPTTRSIDMGGGWHDALSLCCPLRVG